MPPNAAHMPALQGESLCEVEYYDSYVVRLHTMGALETDEMCLVSCCAKGRQTKREEKWAN